MERIRTNVYIDAANLNKGVAKVGLEIDYAKFYLWLKKKYKIQDVFIFFGYIPKLETEYRYLESLGYKLIFKETQREEKILKANCDAELILNCLVHFFNKKFDQMILVSGDGDYTCLVKFLIENKSFQQIITPNREECSIFLKRSTTKIMYIELVPDLFCSPKIKKLLDRDVPLSGSFS